MVALWLERGSVFWDRALRRQLENHSIGGKWQVSLILSLLYREWVYLQICLFIISGNLNSVILYYAYFVFVSDVETLSFLITATKTGLLTNVETKWKPLEKIDSF